MNNKDLTPHENKGQHNTVPSNQIDFKTYSVFSLIIAIFSLLFMCFPPAQMVLSVLAIMFAFLSRNNKIFTGFAKAGLLIGVFSCFTSFLFWAVAVKNLSNPQNNAFFNEIYRSLEQMYGTSYQQ